MRTSLLVLSVTVSTLVGVSCSGGTGEVITPTGTTAPATSLIAQPADDIDPPSTVSTIEDRTITVGGMGSEYAEADRSVLDIGVTVRRPSVREASQAATDSARALTGALRTAGVTDEQVQTSEFHVQPFYDDWPAISGYETTIGYRVTIPDVAMVGDVLAQGIEAGGDDVRAWGIRFETDPTGLMETAREQAWADVIGRAAALADLAGETLGPVVDAHEKVLVSTTQGMYQGGEGDSAHFDIPVSPGRAGVVVLLTVTFAIGVG